ncbi:MAG TPA: phosphatase PAP2 family protein [Anaerolineales bacterium]|nr:phosphatase PAP2 family protein [Anaerolineales bacterium]
MIPKNGRKLQKETDTSLRARLKHTIRTYSPVTWLVFLIASLVVFLAWMPSQMRVIIWDALVARGIISSMLLAFSLLAVSLVWSIGQRMDDWAFLFFNLRGKRPIWLDRSMLVFTQIGSGIFAMVVGLVLFLTGNRLIAYELMLGTITLWIVVELIKALVRRPRPFIRVTQARTVGHQARGRSFPSGHTSQIFFMATLMAKYFHFSAWIVFLLYALALVVGITRMYVGAHYPRDVLAGAILGSAWGLLGVLVNEYNLNGTG